MSVDAPVKPGRPNIAEVNRERAEERNKVTATVKSHIVGPLNDIRKHIEKLPLKADKDRLTKMVDKLSEFATGEKPAAEPEGTEPLPL